MKRPDPGQEIAVSNALVPVAPINRDTDNRDSNRPRRATRPDCGFIAHLIATKAQAPQTRNRRRAEPGEAISVYNGLGDRPGTAGRVLSRSL
jgi:hypothetical protein